MNAIGKLAIQGHGGVWRDDAEFNAILRALCVPHENDVREQTKRKASVEVAMQPFSVARWALWKGGEGQLPHGVWVPFGAARSNEHRHTRARKFRHDPSETHPQEQRGEGFTQRESWGGRLDVDKTSAPPPKVFPAMRPALFAQALRARGSAVRVWDQAALRDFRGVLFFRRAKKHGDNRRRMFRRV